jgi:hypothetical protein
VFGAAPETLEEGPAEGPPDDTTPTVPGDLSSEVRRLLDLAAQAFAEADAALRAGDPVEYARKVQEGRQLFEQARQAAGTPTATPPPDEG